MAGPMKSVFASAAAAGAAALFALLAPGCSSSDPAPFDPLAPVTSCDSAKCAEGNQCLVLDGDLKCRRPCTSNVEASGACPAGYTCVGANEPAKLPAAGCTKIENNRELCAGLVAASGTRLFPYTCTDTKPLKGCTGTGDGTTFCCDDAAPETLAAPLCVKGYPTGVTPGPKQWGTPCNPQQGQSNNPACDLDQGFVCFASSPTDATAYCSRFDCTSDRECGPGFGCTVVNTQPNAIRTARSYHETRSVCARRTYGSSCTADVDCLAINGITAHCATDANGAGFCTPECSASANCNVDAKCVDPGLGLKVCYPRADVIVGDGSLCSPCRSDADCGDDGLCIGGAYTTERFCAKQATTCTASETKCPPSAKAGADIRCQVPKAGAPSPSDGLCFGLYSVGGSLDFGCWTPARKEQ
ncbi:MAG: hypothetical protein JWP97_6411 [Labilithrix sp.]|nr:hypothetical protein [Labilithrix sp.]